MTAMIDVVFLLLIFFLVTTTFIKPERQLTGNIRTEHADAGLQPSDLDPAIVDIYQLGNRVLYQLGATRTSELKKLMDIMRDFENKADGAFVRVGGDVPFEHAAQVIGAFKANGFANVSYLPAE